MDETLKPFRCAQKCERGTTWMAKASLAQCFEDAATCGCHCHEVEVATRAATARWRAAGGQFVHQLPLPALKQRERDR